ncbi:MAG TPA: phosphoribosylformylglycinamidine cyclo-ligase [Candidatus Limnocylindrales bacterium]|nr:phosphoribosylformylglycinamidine cyclo-ligase [Candidatus Limnocylindrales bacterium]
MSPGARDAYAAAGVDVAAGDRAVELMRAAVEATRRPEVVGGLGGFAGAVGLPAGVRDPLLVSATDGVGTKTAIAAGLGRYDTIGVDLVAMCVDDVVCSGATPLFFLDYLAVGRLDPERVATVVGGVAEGCRIAGCALVGGETAEHPGLMPPDGLDLAGFCVGVVDRQQALDGSSVRPGDAIVGLAASGFHANGFSLVRRVLDDHGIGLDADFGAVVTRALGPAAATGLGPGSPSIGEVLLTPTRIYAADLLAARAALQAAGTDLHGLAHVTGGGLPGNVPRALPDGLAARLDPGRWKVPTEMRLVAALAGMGDEEVRATFNAGIGMAAVVAPEDAAALVGMLVERGIPSRVIGEVVSQRDAGGQRYAEGPLTGPAGSEAG